MSRRDWALDPCAALNAGHWLISSGQADEIRQSEKISAEAGPIWSVRALSVDKSSDDRYNKIQDIKGVRSGDVSCGAAIAARLTISHPGDLPARVASLLRLRIQLVTFSARFD